jgi:predicted nuclease with TOPRIM domain
MHLPYSRVHGFLLTFLLAFISLQPLFGGVSRSIQDKYKRGYENKALFLNIPVFAEKQYVYITGKTFRAEQGTGTPRFKVGDQLRVLGVDFGGDEIRFRMGAISSAAMVEIVFKFDGNLQETFPNSGVFDQTLQSTFTEGLKYSDLEDAKRKYIEDQFNRSVREIADSADTGREVVLKNVAPLVPAYEEATREIENLKGRYQDVSSQLNAAQAENRRLDAELKNQQAEVARLRSANTSLQEKMDSSAFQLSKLGEELRNARGITQGYQRELANLQRSLNLKVDSNRDLATQIGDLAQALRKLQKDNAGLDAQLTSMRASLEAQQTANAKLSRDNDDLKSSNRQMNETIRTLTSKEDSLARQYIDLRKNKENLENITMSVAALNTRIVDERSEKGVRYEKVEVYVGNILLGVVDWQLPVQLNLQEQYRAEAGFSMESIDYVKIGSDERHILRSLGERIKIGIKLVSLSPTLDIQSDKGEATQTVGERDRATWHWNIINRGMQDGRLLLTVQLINGNSDSIPLLHEEQMVISSNVVRQVRTYLQPIPLVAGMVIGFVLFGIVGIFRRAKTSHSAATHFRANPADSSPHSDKKQL